MRLIRSKKPKIVYSSEYNYGLSSVGNYSAFDIKKYKRIYEKLLEEKLIKKRDILRPQMCPYEDLKLFHTEEYLQKIKNPQYINEVLNLDTNDLIYNSVLEYYRSVTGGTLLATAYALKWNAAVDVEIGQNKDILLPQNCDDELYLSILEKELTDSCMDFNPDAVFYIAGSDPYEKDTLADMNLSREGLLRRNLYVYHKVMKRKIPLIVVAGGGYGKDSWEIYFDFIAHCLRNKK